MEKLFNHILVPVNFNRNTEMVMEKAIEIANQFECDLRVLYVQTPVMAIPFLYDGHFSGTLYNNNREELEEKMNNLGKQYRSRLATGLKMTTDVTAGNWYVVVKEQVIKSRIDLVVIPRNEKKFLGALLYRININRLTLQTQCPVLTVTKDFDITHLQNIVVPVADFLPVRKLTAATYMARKMNGVIHLMGRSESNGQDSEKETRQLTRAYQLLRDYTNVKVYCSSRTGNSYAEDTLAYAQKVNADLIVVNPGKESVFKGWIGKLTGKYMYKESNIPVLTVAPKQ